MQKFTDALSREWNIKIAIRELKAVREATRTREGGPVDLYAVERAGTFTALSDPITLADVLFAVVTDQAKAAGITADQFASGITGDVIEEAGDALMRAVADFFPSDRRAVLLAAIDGGKTASEAAYTAMLAQLTAPVAQPGVNAAE